MFRGGPKSVGETSLRFTVQSCCVTGAGFGETNWEGYNSNTIPRRTVLGSSRRRSTLSPARSANARNCLSIGCLLVGGKNSVNCLLMLCCFCQLLSLGCELRLFSWLLMLIAKKRFTLNSLPFGHFRQFQCKKKYFLTFSHRF